MDKYVAWVNETKIKNTIKSLENNNMKGYLANNKDELIKIIDELTNEGDTVSCGGSMTLFEAGVIDYLRSKRFNFLDRYEENLTKDGLKELYRKTFSADVFFTSTNAITEDGELYNVDGNGNRVAAMLYGPDKVIVVVGVNKIVKNINEAVERNKSMCAPANAKRLDTNTPCKIKGYCMDCSSTDRICCEYTVIKRQRTANRIHVIFLNENLGYYIGLYDTWSSYKPEDKGVLVAYASIHGNTAKAAQKFAEMLRAKGVEKVSVMDLSRDDMAEVVEDAFRYDRMVLAAASYDGGVFPCMQDFLHHLQSKAFQNRTVGIIENGTWGPTAGRTMKGILETMKNITIVEPMVTIRSTMKESDLPAMEALADVIANA